MAKINLTPRESKKKKDKYSEISDLKKEYKYNMNDTPIYIGLKVAYKGLQCSIIKRSTRKGTHYYDLKFEDEETINSVSDVFLKSSTEYEQWLLEQENKDENDQNNMSEYEIELAKEGIESYHNYGSCLHPVQYYHRDCLGCSYSKRCVCTSKGKYKKLDNN